MKTNILIGLGMIALVLFTGCSSSIEVIKVEDKLHNGYDNLLWKTCETSTGALIECIGCSTEHYQVCTKNKYLDGKYKCKC